MRSLQTLARSAARCRRAGQAARYCGLVPTLYNLMWAEKEEMEETNETEETEEMEDITINYF
jgi:hypothetical protein